MCEKREGASAAWQRVIHEQKRHHTTRRHAANRTGAGQPTPAHNRLFHSFDCAKKSGEGRRSGAASGAQRDSGAATAHHRRPPWFTKTAPTWVGKRRLTKKRIEIVKTPAQPHTGLTAGRGAVGTQHRRVTRVRTGLPRHCGVDDLAAATAAVTLAVPIVQWYQSARRYCRIGSPVPW